MACPTCGLDNDPSASACARCNAALAGTPAPPGSQDPRFARPPQHTNRIPLVAGIGVVVLLALVAVAVLNDRGGGGGGEATGATAPAAPPGPATDIELP